MKKIYVNPAIEVLLMESTELMETSLGVYDTEITKEEMLSREIDMFFDDED
jgi:hypothetical protein